jgi:iron only hydrogenase large subunit-like protein
METEAKKKGLLATIWESMTKTGGCCGGGGSCCGPSKEDDKRTIEKEAEEKSDK